MSSAIGVICRKLGAQTAFAERIGLHDARQNAVGVFGYFWIALGLGYGCVQHRSSAPPCGLCNAATVGQHVDPRHHIGNRSVLDPAFAYEVVLISMKRIAIVARLIAPASGCSAYIYTGEKFTFKF